MNHAVKKQGGDGKYRIIYHAYTTNIIALTCPVVFLNGVGIIP